MRTTRKATVAEFLPDLFNAPILSVTMAHELRAIFPAFLAAAGISALGFMRHGTGDSFGLIGYVLGCAMIGALAAGHDFAHRTIALSLTQPVERAAIWRSRMLAAALAMLPLLIMAWNQHGLARSLRMVTGSTWTVVVLAAPVLLGLCIAPWLTLLCRSALAGTVFTLCVPFLLALVSRLILAVRYARRGEFTPEPWDWLFLYGVNSLLLLVACGWAAYAARRRFLSLEVIDGSAGISWRDAKPSFPQSARISSMRGFPLLRLALKECRLYTLALLPALGLFTTLLIWQNAEGAAQLAPILTVFWAAFCCILLGALSSAEERQLGTAEWQSLLPVSTWTQWFVKLAVLLSLGGLAVVLLPAIAARVGRWKYPLDEALGMTVQFAPAGAILLFLSLYVSSLCQTTMRAILCSAFVCAAAIWGMAASYVFIRQRFADSGLEDLVGSVRMAWEPAAIIGVSMLSLAWFARQNHFSSERFGATALKQVGATVLLTIAAFIAALSAVVLSTSLAGPL